MELNKLTMAFIILYYNFFADNQSEEMFICANPISALSSGVSVGRQPEFYIDKRF